MKGKGLGSLPFMVVGGVCSAVEPFAFFVEQRKERSANKPRKSLIFNYEGSNASFTHSQIN